MDGYRTPFMLLVIYHWVDGAEVLEKYQPGGYHPIMIGDLLHRRHTRITATGKAILRDLSCQHQSSTSLPGRDLVPKLLDEFELHGPSGTHPCHITTPAQCDLKQASFSQVFPLDVTEALAAGLSLAVAYVHFCGYVHGASSSVNHLSIKQFYEKYSKPEEEPITQKGLPWRPPEARFEPETPLSCSSDIWSLGATLWEIIGMKTIIGSDFTTADEVTSQQIEVLGQLPPSWWDRWEERGQFLDEIGRLLEGREVWEPFIKEEGAACF
ncbi:hypothetical protein BJY04DRAFT_205408 [Aspergillus karnatakaensis]|uniref:uncharacterized protein n=1 Tax=Aspergillus karnatakaensis TaxID=1810916 RepID=UPI003CCC9D1B